MSDLTPLAERALDQIKATHGSVGHMTYRTSFDAEVQAAFRPVMDELYGAGYLTRTTYLVDRTRKGFWEDDLHVSLSDEEAAEAVECQRAGTPFVNPETGDERVPGPDDLFLSYCTTSKVPVLLPPPDGRAVALHAQLLAKVLHLREEARRLHDTPGKEYDAGVAEGRAGASEEAAGHLAEAFGIRPLAASKPSAP